MSRRQTADELPDVGQDGLLVAGEGPVIGAFELDESRLRDVAAVMNWAIANGYKWLRSTGLSYEPKFRMRHDLDPLDLYVRLRSPLPNAIFGLLLP